MSLLCLSFDASRPILDGRRRPSNGVEDLEGAAAFFLPGEGENVYVFWEYIIATHFSLESFSHPEALLLKTRRHSSRRHYTVVTPRSFYSSKSLFLMGVTSQGIKAYNSVVRDFLFPGECELKILR